MSTGPGTKGSITIKTAPSQASPETEADPPTVAAEVTGEVVAEDAGVLAVRRGQGFQDLTPRQRAALTAIVNFNVDDPTSWPHIEVFLDVCAMRNLNPWGAREAYLIRRGSEEYDNVTYTIQTGIDGYRKLGNSSGRYHSAATVYWTGADDDEAWWVTAADKNGIMVRRRVWVDAWIWPDKHPAAARAVIEHYDSRGKVQTSDAVAHWGLFAPYRQKQAGFGKARYKVFDPATGKPVMELVPGLWSGRDGGAQQLGKCVEAQVLRKAFPAQTSGIYVDAEMHQADARAYDDDAAIARAEAFARAQEAAGVHTPGGAHAHGGPPDDARTPDAHGGAHASGARDARTPDARTPNAAHTGAAHTGAAHTPDDAHAHTTDGGEAADPRAHEAWVEETYGPFPDGETVASMEHRWLMNEVAAFADIIGKPLAELTAALEHRTGRPLAESSARSLVKTVGPFRAGVVDTLRVQGRDDEADMLAAAGDSRIMPPHLLFAAHVHEGDTRTNDDEGVHTG